MLPLLRTELVLEALQGVIHVDRVGGGVLVGFGRVDRLGLEQRRLEVTETPATADSRTWSARGETVTASPGVLEFLLDLRHTLELCLGHTLGREVKDLELVLGSREGLAPSEHELTRQDLLPDEVALIVASSPTRVVVLEPVTLTVETVRRDDPAHTAAGRAGGRPPS